MAQIVISARDANHQFAEILGRAVAGETVIITRRGKPVATLTPYHPEAASPARKAAWKELLAMLRRGIAIGITDAEARAYKFDREELYNNEDGNPRGTPRGW